MEGCTPSYFSAILDALQTSLMTELPKLNFDYLQMHEQSMTVARHLNAELRERLGRLGSVANDDCYGRAGSCKSN